MRSDRLYLADIVEAADAIADLVRGVERQDFLQNELVKSAAAEADRNRRGCGPLVTGLPRQSTTNRMARYRQFP